MKVEKNHIFSAQKADTLDNKIRRLLQNPYKILAPFVEKGITVLDYGCGNGYFTIPLSDLVGNEGKVYSVDIQKEMLVKLATKIFDLQISNITPILVTEGYTNRMELIDLIITVYVIHEIPDKNNFFQEMFEILKPTGRLLIIEPDFIVSRQNFANTVDIAKKVGFIENQKLNFLLSKARLFSKIELKKLH